MIVELQNVISITLSKVVSGATCHKTDLPEPAVMTYQAPSKTKLSKIKRTDSIEPDERIQIALPLFEFLSSDKPFAGGRLSLFAGIIVI